jgi:hypothetical protein
VPQSDAAFCAARNRVCGAATGLDNCNVTRTVASCGTCSAPNTCNSSGRCVCVPETDAELCAASGANCGLFTGIDRCGNSNTVNSCGTCATGQFCGAGGGLNRCGPTTCSRDGWCWGFRAPQNEPLGALWASSGAAVWAGGIAGQLLRFNGTQWVSGNSPVATPITALHGTSANDVWAATSQAMLHFDGTSWTATPLPGWNVSDVWARSPTEAWAVANVGVGQWAVLRWSGGTWVIDTSSATGLQRLYGFANGDLWVGGSGPSMLVRQGGAWSTVPIAGADPSFILTDVWGSSAADVWMLGSDLVGPSDPVLFRFNGSTFVPAPAPVGVFNADGLTGTGPSDVWMEGTVSSPFSQRVALRFDGAAWSQVSFDSADDLSALFSVSPTEVWGTARGTRRFDGTQFRTVSTGSPNVNLLGVWAPSAAEAFTAGGGGSVCGIARYLPALANLACIPGGSLSGVTDVWGSSATNVWWVGNALYQWNGSALSTTARPANVNPLNAIHGASANEVWAVGQGGSMVRFNGTSWARTGIGVTTSTLHGVSVASPTAVFVVGANGARFRFDGTSWTNDSLALGPTLNAVSAVSATDVWAVGNNGSIFRFDGTSWSSLPSGTTATLTGVLARASNDVFITGPSGLVLRWNGTSLTTQLTHQSQSQAIAAGGSALFLVGTGGLLQKGP